MTRIDGFTGSYEAQIRLACFFGIFAVMAGWELLAPRRVLTASKKRRWLGNLGMTAMNGILARLLFPAGAVGVALLVREQGWGLFNYFQTPYGIAAASSVAALDCAVYWQHVLFHRLPLLWRLHRVHHADLDIDVTTGSRFHPIEILLSLLIKSAVIILLGTPVLGVLIFEVVLNATAMFNHSNVRLSAAFDAILRWLIVTPDMHRVHHSVVAAETNSNFGFNLPWWDRLFGTYRAQPQAGHEAMTIGLSQYRHERTSSPRWMLANPFVREG